MKKKGRGGGERPGRVKSHILLYLAEKGEAKFENIREELAVRYGIRATTGIRRHLKQLEKDGLIGTRRIYKGKEEYYNYLYFLAPGFHSFKLIFDFLESQGFERELMTEKYYVDYVGSEDFKSKFLINMYKENYLKLYEYALKRVPAHGLEEFYSGHYLLDIIHAFQKYTVDELPDVIKAEVKEKGIALNYYHDYDDFLKTLHREVLHKDEVPLVLKMVKTSPSTISYILKPKLVDPEGVPTVMLGSFAIGSGPTDLIFNYKGIIEFLSKDESLNYAILKSEFITDVINGDVLIREPNGKTRDEK